MAFNSESIVQEVRQEFESLIELVQTDKTATADGMERQLFRRLLAVGYQLLRLFFLLRQMSCSREAVPHENGGEMPYKQEKPRSYFSVFGKMVIERPYFYQAEVGGVAPLDAELSLGADCYSDLLRDLAELLGVEDAYTKVVGFLARWLDQELSTQAVSGMVRADAAYVEAYYAQKAAPAPASEAEILVAQADGKGVPMVRESPAVPQVRLGKGEKRTKKKEAVVTALYPIAPQVRTPEAIIQSFFHPELDAPEASPPTRAPQNKEVWATLAGKEAALTRLADRVGKREGAPITQRVALTDGCAAWQTQMQTALPTFTLVLDFIHAQEYLWQAANALFAETDAQRLAWVETQALALLSGQTEQVIQTIRSLAAAPARSPARQESLHKVANYFARNRPFMHYDVYLACGWPIASGVVEGACRHLVKDRCEQTGMRWTQPGAEALLGLRTVATNDDWDDFHHFRQRQRHQRLYHTPYPDLDASQPDAAPSSPPLPPKLIPIQRVFPASTARTLHRAA